jgi:hypothetical protein
MPSCAHVCVYAVAFNPLSMIGTSSPSNFCDRSGLLRMWVECSAEKSITPITAETNSLAGREPGQEVVLRLLLQVLAFLSPVVDMLAMTN